MGARVVLGVIGLAATAYGLLLVAGRGLDQVLDAAVWGVGGVLAHDLLLAPLVVVAGVLVVRVLPPTARAPVVVGLVVLGSVTLVAVPVLGRFGASPGNDTLLDRNYVAGWWVVAGLAAVGVAAAVLRRSRGRRGGRGVRHGR